MTINNTRSAQASVSSAAAAAALAKDAVVRRADSSAPGSPAGHKPAGFGLPCAKCRLYYPADLDICPNCHHNERVSPVMPRIPHRMAQTVSDAVPDSAVIEQEREEFLRQFKSHLLEAHADVANAPGSKCTSGVHDEDELATAEICKTCHDHLQERLDICEAALHIELKEASQIIYDAVWADPSDPSKTYQNAANALLAELRKRAGLNTLLGPFQPLEH